MEQSTDMDQFREVLRQSKHIVAIAGAGLSAASGIPTFRGAGGLWRSYDAISLVTPEAFHANPSRVWQFYHMRREKALKCKPNAAHYALALLVHLAGKLKTVAPNATFTLVAQNVDELSVRALEDVCMSSGDDPASILEPKRPPRPIYEMHGRVFDTVCTSCGQRKSNHDSPICPALNGTEEVMVRQEQELAIPDEDLPRCRLCNGLLRPGVVWFGETPHFLDEIQQVVDRADLGIVVGTSSTVYPAAGYAGDIADNGGKVAIFNLDRSEGDEDADFLFLGPCEGTLPKALLEE